jgi:hypothetical protein
MLESGHGKNCDWHLQMQKHQQHAVTVVVVVVARQLYNYYVH